ncbi:pilus assembly protein TadG-related protein [Streptomyces qinglanensis]|uniref:pilus assembly protein TadG-related protein n=1 Tax=Streptomyces qinglanensis TaxID=943816 RepID=UPI003D75FF96
MSRRAATRERAAAWLRAREAACDDRGSGAAAVIMFALLFMALAAFVVDGGLSISQRERAADIAEQAARYAAQDIDEEALRASQGNSAPINYENCGARVHEFATRSGLPAADVAASGCVSASAQQVRVRIRLTYRPVLTGLFYSAPLTVHGTATAESVTG